MNETVLTVVGNVASEPQLRVTTTRRPGGQLPARRRPSGASTRRCRPGATATPTFYSVSCWRSAAENVVDSLEKGQPVVVHGRFRHRSFEQDGVQRCALEIDAFTVGHDLTRGVGTFTKATGPRREEFVEPDAAVGSAAAGRRAAWSWPRSERRASSSAA